MLDVKVEDLDHSAYHKIEGEYLFGYLNKTSLCAFLGGTVKPLGRSTINDWIRA